MSMLKKDVIEALIIIGKKYALKYGYHIDKDLERDDYQLRCFERGELTIAVRQRFSNYRLDIYGPNREWFVSVEYSPYGNYVESQVFKEKGIWKLIEIKKAVDKIMIEKLHP